jgi:hypothetical protein
MGYSTSCVTSGSNSSPWSRLAQQIPAQSTAHLTVLSGKGKLTGIEMSVTCEMPIGEADSTDRGPGQAAPGTRSVHQFPETLEVGSTRLNDVGTAVGRKHSGIALCAVETGVLYEIVELVIPARRSPAALVISTLAGKVTLGGA